MEKNTKNNIINNMFIDSIFKNDKNKKYYYALVELENGDIAKSPTYSKEVLFDFLKYTENEYVKVLKIKAI